MVSPHTLSRMSNGPVRTKTGIT